MSDFESAVNFVLANEGGLSENPNDAGGITNHGISLRFLRSFGSKYDLNKNGILEDDIRNMTLDQAKRVYYEEFWQTAPFAKILNQQIANYVFDMCVHHGVATGIRLLQRATWSSFRRSGYVYDDGVLGEKTLSAANMGGFTLIYALPPERAGYCRLIAEQRSKNEGFLKGWLERCYRI
jgi:lysozyme family protein